MIKEDKKVKSEKGITMVVLVITVLLLMIVTASLATHSYDSVQLSHLTKLDNDIETLNNRVASYYVEHGTLPILGEAMTKEDVSKYISDLSRNDGDKYYIIDLGELENITLNYGKGYLSRSTDSYIINEESHIIYYLKGIYYDDKMHYSVGNYQAAVVEKESTSQILKTNIGDYVSYTPTSSKYTVEGLYSGYDSSNTSAKEGTSNQTFSTNTTVKWRIYSIDDTTLTLISSDVVNSNLYLQGADGYNNAVYLLNYACKKLYSNYEMNATARSIKIEDIERVSRYNPSTDENYGNEFTSNDANNYPNIFIQEQGANINGDGFGGGIALSEQAGFVKGATTANSLKVKKTHYTYEMSTEYFNQEYLNLLMYKEGSTSTNMSSYWIAARSYFLSDDGIHYDVRAMQDGKVWANCVLTSNNTAYTRIAALRPMVEIPLEYVNFAKTGSGTKDDPWSLDVNDKPKSGDYVNYTPKTETYVAEKRYTGIDEDKSYTTDTSTKWRIFKIDKDYITLIPTNVVNSGFTLKGADGYNNAVYLLNDVCNKLYSNSDYGAIARSINELDVYNVTNYDKTTYNNELYGTYGKEYEPVTATHTYYPNIFAQEISSNIDGQGYGKGLLNQSDQTNLVTGSTKATSLKWHSSYYQFNATMSSTYKSLIFYKENTASTAIENYFFASRCVLLSSNVPHFDVGYIRSGGLSWMTLYASDNVDTKLEYAIRPLVQIPLSKAKLAKPLNGNISSGYVLMVK